VEAWRIRFGHEEADVAKRSQPVLEEFKMIHFLKKEGKKDEMTLFSFRS